MKNSVSALLIVIGWWPVCCAKAETVTFDFDMATPALARGQGTPFDQVSGGVTARFSSPSDTLTAAFSVQTDASNPGWKLSKFCGNYVYPNNQNRNVLQIQSKPPAGDKKTGAANRLLKGTDT